MPKTGVQRGAREESAMCRLLIRFIKGQSGVTAIEYGLIASLIAVAIIGAVTTLGSKLTTVFNQVAGSLT
jgi:pilus assembly protein Flp/PilA